MHLYMSYDTPVNSPVSGLQFGTDDEQITACYKAQHRKSYHIIMNCNLFAFGLHIEIHKSNNYHRLSHFG